MPNLAAAATVVWVQLMGNESDSQLERAATVAGQREALQKAAEGKNWLVVLDDVWAPEAEKILNFIDPASAPESKVFVTTRFGKMLPGYVL